MPRDDIYPHVAASRHARRNPRHSCRLRHRPDDQIGRRADLPDRCLRVRQRRAWRRPVRPRGRGQYLHPAQQSDQRRPRKASRGARRRRRRAERRLRRGRDPLRPRHAARAGHQFRLGAAALRRDLHAVRPCLQEAGHRGALRQKRQRRRRRRLHRRATPARSIAKASATRPATSSISRRSPPSRMGRACR